MKRAIGLLLVLVGLAWGATVALRSYASNCNRIEHAAHDSAAMLELCSAQLACRYEFADLVALSKQVQAAKRCRARDDE